MIFEGIDLKNIKNKFRNLIKKKNWFNSFNLLIIYDVNLS